MLNKTNLAAPLGVSVPTVTQWLGILETTAQILVVSPFAGSLFEGFIASEIVKAQVNDGRPDGSRSASTSSDFVA